MSYYLHVGIPDSSSTMMFLLFLVQISLIAFLKELLSKALASLIGLLSRSPESGVIRIILPFAIFREPSTSESDKVGFKLLCECHSDTASQSGNPGFRQKKKKIDTSLDQN